LEKKYDVKIVGTLSQTLRFISIGSQKKKIKKIIGEKELEKLTTLNAEKMILNI